MMDGRRKANTFLRRAIVGQLAGVRVVRFLSARLLTDFIRLHRDGTFVNRNT